MTTVTTSSYTTRLAARKAANTDPQGAASEQDTNLNLPEDDVASAQLETDGRLDRPGGRRVGFSERSDANQRDRPVHRTLARSLPSGEAEEVDPPLPLQGSSPGGRRAGFSLQDGQDDRSKPGEELRARRAGRPGPDRQGADLNQGDAPDCPDREGPGPGDPTS